MSSTRSGLGRLFHRRDASNAASESAPTAGTSDVPRRSESNARREGQRRSFGDFVRSRSRSLSRSRHIHRRNESDDIPSPPDVPDGVNVPSRPRTREARAPQRPSRDGLPTDQSLLTLQATGPSVPPRSTSLHARRRSTQQGNTVPIYTSMMKADDPYSEKVADWNLVQSENPLRGTVEDVPEPLRVARRSDSVSNSSESQKFRHETPGNLAHKPDVQNLRNPVHDASGSGRGVVEHEQNPTQTPNIAIRRIPRKSLDKPLPTMPAVGETKAEENASSDPTSSDAIAGTEPERQRGYLIKDSKEPIDLSGVVDLSRTEEIHEDVQWAPAVTHEKRIVNTHEIVQEAVTREIHNHHVYHRVLPIIDIEVLPARHFVVGNDGGYREIAESEIPGGNNASRLQQLLNEAVSKMLPENKMPSGPRQFTARTFEGTEGDYKEYTTTDGIKRTEQWWVHPPTLETGGQESGQTEPFHFGSENPADDGIRRIVASMPAPNFSRKTPSAQAAWYPEPERLAPQPQQQSTHTVLPIRMQHGGVTA